ncbi:three-Cys-motif partner protein TcmP [Deinococcus sp. Marseille-Q6407]|uniref:three-Cys-motif partner protein TcmP n=1 Tax=Deinococcus sp. Marseille-Q6407 TaxID=2969223 RepID=UPI0021C1B1FF|nr:three-Cys-motif partner protein TcmP [Deinococcus sp. Marseille-Q6407]
MWTADKLEFLERYLPAFQLACKRFWNEQEGHTNTYYVDGFAGPGKNDINGVLRKGSPLIAASVKPPFKEYFLIEKGLKNVNQLKAELAADEYSGIRQHIHLQRGDFNKEVASILRQMQRNLPTFYLMDPEGLELEWETVRQIGDRPKADLFILVSAGGVTRCAGSPPTHDRVTQFYGHERWRPIAEGLNPQTVMRQSKFEAFLELYLEGLRGLGFSHVERYLIATNSKNSNLHTLVFASKNGTALRIAEDILKKIERDKQGMDRLF